MHKLRCLLSAENPELRKFLSLKPEIGQNIRIAITLCLLSGISRFLIYAFLLHSTFFVTLLVCCGICRVVFNEFGLIG